MILKKTFILAFASISISIIAQTNVCDSSSEFDIMMELNNIDKCYAKNDNETNNHKDVTIATRNRYVRSKKNLTTTVKKKVNVTPKINKPSFVKFKNLTQKPVLLTLMGASEYKNDLDKALKHYINENLVYPADAKRNNIEARVWVSFIIDTKGFIKNVVTFGPINGKVFEKETERLIKKIPNFIPGKLNGEYVNIKYLMTVDFELN